MHPLLARQIERHLDEALQANPALQRFLLAVDEAYRRSELDLNLTERALSLASQELSERNAALQRELTERRYAETELKREKAEQAALIERLAQAHNQLLQSEKLASIGQLAAGVAHEINNPIGYVYSNIGSLQSYVGDLIYLLDTHRDAARELPPLLRDALAARHQALDYEFLREDIGALMRESQEGIERVRKIVEDLKDFSRADSGEAWQWSDLHRGMESTLNIVNNEIKYRAEVVREYGELPPIECLPSQINQVFMNLLVNAAHSMEGRRHGTITIRTGQAREEVWVEVEDQGCGMSPAVRDRIFDPFFTTKPVGKGTGLGLSLAYGIVRKHRGRIEVESQPEHGSIFRVVLPVRRESEEASDA